jgi:hypothetical protein
MANSIKIETEEQKKLRRLKSDFVQDFQAEKEWRDDKEEYGNFYDGDQLSAEEKNVLEQRGQPNVVINRIKPKIDAIIGIQEALQVDTKAYPSGDREEEVEIVSEELRRIEDGSDFDAEESLVFEDQLIDGRGWLKAFKEFDGIEGVDRVKHVANDKIVLDRYCSEEDRRTGDLKTAKRLHETTWLDLEDASEMFPKAKDQLEEAIRHPEMGAPMVGDKLQEANPDQYAQPGGAQSADSDLSDLATFVDDKKKRLRLVTSYYRTPKVTKYIKHSGGTANVTGNSEADTNKMLDTLEGATFWTETSWQLNSCTFAWNVILEEKKDIRPYDKQGKYPLFMVPAYVTRDKKRKPYGLVKQLMDPQREVNKRRSKMLHLLNTNQLWYEDGAFEDVNKAAKEMSKPDGKVAYRKEFKVDRVTHGELAQAQFQLLQESKGEVDTSGVSQEIEGHSRATSGRDFQLRQQQAMQSIRKLFVNLRAARKRIGYYLLDEILYRNPELQLKKVDLVIEEAPDTINIMSETFDTLASLAKGGLPIPMDMLIESSPLQTNKKKEILEKVKEQEAQQAQMQAMMAAQGQQQVKQ